MRRIGENSQLQMPMTEPVPLTSQAGTATSSGTRMQQGTGHALAATQPLAPRDATRPASAPLSNAPVVSARAALFGALGVEVAKVAPSLLTPDEQESYHGLMERFSDASYDLAVAKARSLEANKNYASAPNDPSAWSKLMDAEAAVKVARHVVTLAQADLNAANEIINQRCG